MTTKPIATSQVKSTQVLHSLLRTFDHFMSTVVHAMAGVYAWSGKSANDKIFIESARRRLQDVIQDHIHGTKWDFPDSGGKGGTTTTGNVAKDLLFKSANRQIIINQLPEKDRDAVEKYGQRLAVILRVMLSSRSVSIPDYKAFCTELYLHLVDNFPCQRGKQNKTGPWISITPTLHKVLGHLWELIQHNNSEGLQRLDESGMEGCNKLLRQIRGTLSRKTSQLDNLTDTLSRMWVSSDPVIQRERMKALPFCTHCNILGHGTRYCSVKNPLMEAQTYDNFLFNSLTLDNNM